LGLPLRGTAGNKVHSWFHHGRFGNFGRGSAWGQYDVRVLFMGCRTYACSRLFIMCCARQSDGGGQLGSSVGLRLLVMGASATRSRCKGTLKGVIMVHGGQLAGVEEGPAVFEGASRPVCISVARFVAATRRGDHGRLVALAASGGERHLTRRSSIRHASCTNCGLRRHGAKWEPAARWWVVQDNMGVTVTATRCNSNGIRCGRC
jgi:hypothetical protein